MTNQKDFPTRSGRTGGQKPETQGRKLDYECWVGTREWAGHKVTGLEWRAGPKANRFQKIKGLKILLFYPYLCKYFQHNKEVTK